MNRSFAEDSFEKFLTDLGSDRPTPGGGPAAAFTAAMGAALGEMVASINSKRKKNSAETNWKSAHNAERLRELKLALTRAADEDARAYGKLVEVWKSPDANLKEAALRGAAEAPMQIIRSAWIAARLCEAEAEWTASVLWSDLVEAVALLCCGMDSAFLNVLANTRYLTDAKTREAIESQARFWLDSSKPIEGRLRRKFEAQIRPDAAKASA